MAGISSSAKTRLDIEDLLKWCYVEEMPKKGVDSGAGGMSQLLTYGTAIDVTSSGMSMPAAAGDPHPDALLLDYHVRSLEPVRFNVNFARFLLGELAPFLSRAVMRTVAIGTIKKGKREYSGYVAAEEMEWVEEWRDQAAKPAALVAIHAKLGNRPNWDVGPARVVRVNGPNNKPIVHGITAGGRYKDGACCPLQLAPSAVTIVRARLEYVTWWCALKELAETCKLSRYLPLSPRAAPLPWVTGEKPAAPIHRGGEAKIPQQRQRHFVEQPPLRTRSGKARQIPFTNPDDGAC